MLEKNKNGIIFVLVIVIFLLWSNFSKLKEESVRKLNICENSLNTAKNTIDEANDNIDQANNNIEEAQWYAWSSYDDMGYALDNLETVDNAY